MTIKTILLPVDKAAFIQKNAAEYGCNFVEIAVAGNNSCDSLKKTPTLTRPRPHGNV